MGRVVRRAAVVVVAAVLSALLVPTPAAASVFTDVAAGAYYAPAVAWGVDVGVTSGVGSTGKFMPDREITRAELVTMLWRADEAPVVDGELPPDVGAGHFAAPAVRWALAAGVTTGVGSSGLFMPDRLITRAEIVTMLWRAAGSPQVGGAGFVDVAPTHFAAAAVRWASAERITSGVGSSGLFMPDRHLSRGEAITFLFRFATGAAAPEVGPPPVGPHSFLLSDASGPMRWDSCATIDWHVDYSGRRFGDAQAAVPAAVAALAARTGLQLRQVGSAADADLRISWASQSADAVFSSSTAVGYARYTYRSGPAGARIVAADVVIRAEFEPGPSTFGGWGSLGTLLLHELGHAAGLGHVADTSQVMNPTLTTHSEFQVGDRYGLWRLGAVANPCTEASTASVGAASTSPSQTGIVVG